MNSLFSSASIPVTKQTLTLISATFAAGIVSLVALALALVVAVIWAAAYVLNIAVTAITELSSHIAITYMHADPLIQLLFLGIAGYGVFRLCVPFIRHLRMLLV